MACSNIVNSTTVGIFIDDVLIAYSTDASLSINHETRDITSKDSGGWRDLMEGLRSWSMNFSALKAAAAGSFGTLFDAIKTRATVQVKIADIGNQETGQVVMADFYSGAAWVGSLTLNSSDSEDNVTYDGTLEGCGVLSNTA